MFDIVFALALLQPPLQPKFSKVRPSPAPTNCQVETITILPLRKEIDWMVRCDQGEYYFQMDLLQQKAISHTFEGEIGISVEEFSTFENHINDWLGHLRNVSADVWRNRINK